MLYGAEEKVGDLVGEGLPRRVEGAHLLERSLAVLLDGERRGTRWDERWARQIAWPIAALGAHSVLRRQLREIRR